jgi:hypothetical protein
VAGFFGFAMSFGLGGLFGLAGLFRYWTVREILRRIERVLFFAEALIGESISGSPTHPDRFAQTNAPRCEY